MLVNITTKYASNNLVTFVTHKRFAVLFVLPSCYVNSLLINSQPLGYLDKAPDKFSTG